VQTSSLRDSSALTTKTTALDAALAKAGYQEHQYRRGTGKWGQSSGKVDRKAAHALTRLKKALAKAYDPNQPRDEEGQWTDTGGGGGGSARVGRGYVQPGTYLSRKINDAADTVREAEKDIDAMRRGNVDTSDDDYQSAVRTLANAEEAHAKLMAERRAQEKSSNHTYSTPNPSPLRPTPRNDQDRRSEDERRLARELEQLGIADQLLNAAGYGSGGEKLSETQRFARASGHSGQSTITSGSLPRPPGNLRGSIFDTIASGAALTQRTAFAASQANNIMQNAKGISSSSDFVEIGRMLNNITQSVGYLAVTVPKIPGEAQRTYQAALRTSQEIQRKAQQMYAAAKKRSAQAWAYTRRVSGVKKNLVEQTALLNAAVTKANG
jgi:hypothetical protein